MIAITVIMILVTFLTGFILGKHSSKKLPVVMGVPKKQTEEQRDYKEELRSAEETIANLDRMCSALREDKEYWFDIADQAHKNEEAILKELNTNLDRILFHCHSVQENTGNVTIDDITYCTILVRRVMENRFAYKPKQEEV
jgi:hypothetical protein